MSTINQVISANEALNTALEEFTSICIASKPRGFKDMSFALEEAVTDVKENAKQTLWERFKAFIGRIVDWVVARFKKLGERKKTEAEKFEEELEQSQAQWRADLDKNLNDIRKANEEYMAKAKPQHDDILKKTEQMMDPKAMDVLYKKVFESMKPQVMVSARDFYNEKLKKNPVLGAMLEQKTYSNSTLSSATRIPLIDEISSEIKRITNNIKALANVLRSDAHNAERIYDAMRGLEGSKLREMSKTFETLDKRDGQHIQASEALTISTITAFANRVKTQFAALGEVQMAEDFQDALESVRESIRNNDSLDENDENFSKVIHEMQGAMSNLVSNVSTSMLSLQIMTTAIRRDIIAIIAIPSVAVSNLVSTYQNQYYNLIKKENNFVLSLAAAVNLRFQIQDMLSE